jgi:hypothetical protein
MTMSKVEKELWSGGRILNSVDLRGWGRVRGWGQLGSNLYFCGC